MEISIVSRLDIPNKPCWAKAVRSKINEIQTKNNGKDVVMVVLKNGESSAALESAWRDIVRKELKKKPHIKALKHELGKTFWLTWD